LSLILFFYSLQIMPIASAVTLQKLSPIFTVLFSFFLFKNHEYIAT
ncbi:MAG: EamA family transporter, partial [Polaribacter sp.]|nr:EamA family transporter [Polaribacter sp.]